jgi:hypothetical protein
MAANGHLALLPFGRKWSDSGDVPYTRMDDLLVQCGADPQRVLAAASIKTDFDSFLERHSVFLWKAEKTTVIIGFTGTRTVGDVFEAREKFEKNFPYLNDNALWILFVDPLKAPYFRQSLEAMGILSVGIDSAPLWTPLGSERRPFLVLTPETNDENLVRSRVELLQRWRPRRKSGIIPAAPPVSGPVSLLELDEVTDKPTSSSR